MQFPEAQRHIAQERGLPVRVSQMDQNYKQNTEVYPDPNGPRTIVTESTF